MKKLKLKKGVEILSKVQQRAITGGLACRHGDGWCPEGTYCCGGPDVGLCRPNGTACI